MEAQWIHEQRSVPESDVFTSFLNVPGGVVVRTVVESAYDGHVAAAVVLVPGVRAACREDVVTLEPSP